MKITEESDSFVHSSFVFVQFGLIFMKTSGIFDS